MTYIYNEFELKERFFPLCGILLKCVAITSISLLDNINFNENF